ncbi:type IV secretion system protein [Gallibacterium anatis]|uniref:type IV secretion system protein n=1 Tax=Gallibacterium anatis TaxID=750 RepID=UPI0030061569
MGFFAELGNKIDTIVDVIVKTLQSNYISGILTIIQVSITIYILIIGLQTLTGKKQTPFIDLIYEIGVLAFIFAFATSPNLLQLISSGIDGLKEFFSFSGQGAYSDLDEKLANLGKSIDTETAKISIGILSDGKKDFLLPILAVIAYVLLGIGFIAVGALIIYNEVMLKILIAVSPIFLFTKMWGWSTTMFNNWLGAIIANTMQILFLGVFMKVSIGIVDWSAAKGDSVIDLLISAALGLYLTIIAIRETKSLASALSGVNAGANGSNGGSMFSAGLAGAIGSSIANFAKNGASRMLGLNDPTNAGGKQNSVQRFANSLANSLNPQRIHQAQSRQQQQSMTNNISNIAKKLGVNLDK